MMTMTSKAAIFSSFGRETKELLNAFLLHSFTVAMLLYVASV